MVEKMFEVNLKNLPNDQKERILEEILTYLRNFE